MSSGQDEPPSKPCHNCRRRRLKCDRTLPGCRKCSKTGQECLGYGKLFLWDQGVASRGKMMGKTIPVQTPAKLPRRDDVQAMSAGLGTGMDTHQHGSNTASQELVLRSSNAWTEPLQPPLIDPIFQDLGHSSRLYLSHCKALRRRRVGLTSDAAV
ncbi:Acriflavine sensitivity control protein acr-2 [Diplodia seriata]|uniref:Acriflavine sensitivity control protein acr-2 n=1 Tax=Diplodia seriata TaxID=420778 RepID=A0A1S8BF40_9PEZI|nr:Acriflavine sensitivity control protein acr-2 [Diplodia seriata]